MKILSGAKLGPHSLMTFVENGLNNFLGSKPNHLSMTACMSLTPLTIPQELS